MLTPKATPNPPNAVPHHQVTYHLHQTAHNHPRQSPHMQPMQIHLPGHVPHVSFSNADDHRMMHSNSAQSYASPRMAQVPIYPPQMNSPAQIAYNQPGMPQFMPGTPQMNQFRSFSSNSPQYIPQQTAPLAMPMMPPQQFVAGPGTMIPGGPQMPMYPGGHPQFISQAAGPQAIPGTNGYPSPGRPAAAALMVQQGSQQGQPMYAMSPGMQFQQPVFAQHPGQSKFRMAKGIISLAVFHNRVNRGC